MRDKIVMKGRNLGNKLSLTKERNGRIQGWKKHIVTSP
jgi:hypothetical protein